MNLHNSEGESSVTGLRWWVRLVFLEFASVASCLAFALLFPFPALASLWEHLRTICPCQIQTHYLSTPRDCSLPKGMNVKHSVPSRGWTWCCSGPLLACRHKCRPAPGMLITVLPEKKAPEVAEIVLHLLQALVSLCRHICT